MQKKRSKREKILDATFEIYREAGFMDVRMEDIAKKAGVGKGTMYQYFSSKEALLEAAVEGCIRGYVTQLETLIKQESSLVGCVRGWTAFHRAAMAQSDSMMALLHSEGFVMSKALKETLHSQRELVSELIAHKVVHLVASGELPRGTDPELVLAVLLGSLTHYYTAGCQKAGVERMETEAFVDRMTRALRQLGSDEAVKS